MRLPIGISDFKDLRARGLHYVDKSAAIIEMLEIDGQVLEITRPRRFGKTLFLSMLRAFFEADPSSRQELFGDLSVASSSHMDHPTTPVLFLTLKDLKAESFAGFVEYFKVLIGELYEQHIDLQDRLNEFEREHYRRVVRRQATNADLARSLLNLSKWVHHYRGQKVMIFIDEYDSPLHEAWAKGYYREAVDFLRGFLGAALKDNPHLDRAVLTGILRVAKESIFSELNNPVVCTMLESRFADTFGFTEAEVLGLLRSSGQEGRLDQVRAWYNGYRIGGVTLYNPWSLLNYASQPENGPQPYGINTSANLMIRDLLVGADAGVQQQIEVLLQGGILRTHLNQHLVFEDLYDNNYNLWNLLLFSGYLRLDQASNPESTEYHLAVPNREVKHIYHHVFAELLNSRVGSVKVQALWTALTQGDAAGFETNLNHLVSGILSYYDTVGGEPERVYHVFVLGLLAYLDGRYLIRSNRESGAGRYDCALIPRAGESGPGMLLEFKTFASGEAAPVLRAALDQIVTRDYAAELRQAEVTRWFEYAVAFNGKWAFVDLRVVGDGPGA